MTRANKSIDDFPAIFDAVGLLHAGSPEETNAYIAARKAPTAEGKLRRAKLHAAIAQKNYEFNCHGVELNQRYVSNAIVPDGTPEPAWQRDRELYYQATTWPGARLPHVWLEQQRKRISSLDLCGHGRFTLLTGLGGEAWLEAARALEIDRYTIGPAGCDAQDIYGDWYTACEIEEDGCILVRPDMHVAWRCHSIITDPGVALTNAMARVLGLLVA